MLTRMRVVASAFMIAVLAVLVSGCAATPGKTMQEDHWEGLNRGVYKFNDALDRAALKPVAKGYKKITPGWMRTGIGNFFSNLTYPGTFVNQFLQGKAVLGLRDTTRFLVNSTIGLAGFLDVATPMGLEKNDEDFGQTLAVWGVGSGPYLTLPLFGPSTMRDAPSRVVEFFLDPLDLVDIPWEAEWGKRALHAVHARADLLPLDATLQRAFDPYAFVRDAWLQRREYAIYDGNPPQEDLDESFYEDMEDFGDEDVQDQKAQDEGSGTQ